MITAIDTNIPLDILVPNENFYEASANAIQSAGGEGGAGDHRILSTRNFAFTSKRSVSATSSSTYPLRFVGRTSWSAADVLVGLLDCVADRASRTGTSGAGQETHPTFCH
jgi:hypothetical protein